MSRPLRVRCCRAIEQISSPPLSYITFLSMTQFSSTLLLLKTSSRATSISLCVQFLPCRTRSFPLSPSLSQSPFVLYFLLFLFLPPLCPPFSSLSLCCSFHPSSILIRAHAAVCASVAPVPAIAQRPVEVHAPTPPTVDQNGDKAPSAKTAHIQYARARRFFLFLFFLSQRMSVMSVARQRCFWKNAASKR